MSYFVNPYRIEGNVAYGLTKDGYGYMVDADVVEWLQRNYTCYYLKRTGTIVAREHEENKNQYQLSKLILGIGLYDKRKVLRYDCSKPDYRRENLWTGNRYEKKEGYIEVTCRNGKTFKIDIDDYELISQYVWHVDVNDYVISERMENGKPIKIHRMIMGILDKPELEVDHIYHDTCDNRKKNMRVTDRCGNVQNIRRNKKSKYGCPGVSLVNGYDNLWKAVITHGGTREYLGCFPTKEEAIQARLNAEKKYGILRTA